MQKELGVKLEKFASSRCSSGVLIFEIKDDTFRFFSIV